MKALVIGASGLVGEALLRVLERSGIEAVGTHYSRSTNPTQKLDVRNREAVCSTFEAVRPSLVFVSVNTPGGVDYCELHPREAYGLNVEGSEVVAEAAAGLHAKLLYYSTDYVFNGKKGPYSEDDELCPINVYGRTKREAEQIVLTRSPGSLVVRTTAVYGWHRGGNNFAMQVWERLQAGESMPVPVDQWCNPTLAEYLAEVSVRLVQMGVEGVINVVGKARIPRSELGCALARAMALDPSLIIPVPTSELDQAAQRPLQGGLKTGKLEQVLGTEPLDLNESMKRFRRNWRADTHTRYTREVLPTDAAQLKQKILEKVKEYYEVVHKPPEFVPYRTRVHYSGRVFAAEEMINLVDSALDFWLTHGPYGDLFEHKMKKFFGARDFVLVNSGSTANLAAVLTLFSKQLDNPLRSGDEVITPALTFPTTLTPLVHSGLIPVFVDCQVGTYNINPCLLEGAISEKTRAIMIPHTLGNPCDLDVVCDVAKRHHLFLIEDSCDALGATFRGKLVGTFGDLGTLSFFPAHQITTGEGGGVIVNRGDLSRIVRSVRDWGRDCWCAPGESNTCGRRFGWQLGGLPKGYDHKYTYSNLGYNFKSTDMQAAIGAAQADRICDFVKKRRANFARLYKELEPYQDYLILPTVDPRSDPSWFAFPVTVKNGCSRQKLVQWMENSNIETRDVFGGNILRQPGFQYIPHRVHGTLDHTDRVMRDTFFIGVYPGLTEGMIEFMIERFRAFFDNVGYR